MSKRKVSSHALRRCLLDVAPGNTAVIHSFGNLPGSQKAALQAYGLLPGAELTILQHSPVTVILIECVELAIEGGIAAGIFVAGPV